MSAYKLPRIAELAHQLRLSPTRLRLQQILAVDHLLTLIDSDQYYPYSWACWRITGYRPAGTAGPEAADMRGSALTHDLLELCQDITRNSPVPEGALPWRAWPIKELADRLHVSSKTISRWRADGLPSWWITLADGQTRLAVPDSGLRRFVAANPQAVLRGKRFSQLTDAEREQVLERAQQLQAAGSQRLHHICNTIAVETGRSVETIRYTLQRHEPQLVQAVTAGSAIAQTSGDDHSIIFQCWQSGDTIEALAERFDRTIRTVRKIILCQRRKRLLGRKAEYVYSPEFDLPDAEARILGQPDQEVPVHESVAVTEGGVHILRPICTGAADPLSPEQEVTTFRRYNYGKFRLFTLQQELRRKVSQPLLEDVERWRRLVEALRDKLVQANLKLVISVAKRHLRFGATLEEMASEGNMILIRAIDKFDYTRGFKFSTYASWAIMKHFARLVPLWQSSRRRQQTGREELLKAASTAEDVSGSLDRQLVGGTIRRLLESLPNRERRIIQWHYGLVDDDAPRTLTQIAGKLGITKERVRQIELRGLGKLREMLADRESQYL